MSSFIKVFVISSAEQIEMAKAVHSNLAKYDVRVWDQLVFSPGDTATESLHKAIENCDFGIVILTPDDEVKCRGKKYSAPRDNVVFELGLCVSMIGMKRTFYLFPRNTSLPFKIPTDIHGINGVPYQFPDANSHLVNVLRPACNIIENSIHELGHRAREKKNAYDFKPEVEIYHYKKTFTRGHADKMATELFKENIHFSIKEHAPDLSPDTIFIGACVPAYHARFVLNLIPYPIKYIYRLDYPEVEGGDCKGFKIGVGYSSAYNKNDTNIKYKPIPISSTQLNYLKDPKISNTEFHNYLYKITMVSSLK